MTLRYLLKRYREDLGLSQRALAKKAGVRQATISNVETGKKKDVISRTALRLAQALGITVEQLHGQDVPPDPFMAPRTHLLVSKVATYGG